MKSVTADNVFVSRDDLRTVLLWAGWNCGDAPQDVINAIDRLGDRELASRGGVVNDRYPDIRSPAESGGEYVPGPYDGSQGDNEGPMPRPTEGDVYEVDTGRTYRWTGTAWQPTEGEPT